MTTVAQAVGQATSDARVQLAMLMGAVLEGGLGPSFAVGDSGTSFGPWQIHLPAHPGVTSAQASDPVQAARFMAPSYAGAVANVPAALWQSDPEKAAEMAVMAAERPAQDYYAARGQAAVDNAYSTALAATVPGASGASGPNVIEAGKIFGVIPTPNIPGDIKSAAGSIISPVLGFIEGWAVRVALVLLGGLIVLIGIYLTFNGSAASAPAEPAAPAEEEEEEEGKQTDSSAPATKAKPKAAAKAKPKAAAKAKPKAAGKPKALKGGEAAGGEAASIGDVAVLAAA